MKIGILTFHRAHNYGAVLQCYALRTVLNRLISDEVVVLDYRQSYIDANYSVFSLKLFIGYLKNIRKAVRYLMDIYKRVIRKNHFVNFQKKYLALDSFPNSSIDIFIIGSDQLWSQRYVGTFDKVYTGQFERRENTKLVSYAISMDVNSCHNMISNYLFLLSNFDALSFRENSISEKINHVSEYKSYVCVDPVLLTEISDWEPLINDDWKKYNYVAVYQIHCPKNNPDNIISLAKKIATYMGCEKIINLSSKLYSPEDFVSIIRYARFVVTSSFHGTAFSILFQKQFCTIKVNDSVDLRSAELLKTLHLSNRLVEYTNANISDEINFSAVKDLLGKVKSNSIKYLRKNL